ncbi:hypothetical protein F4810DRAFT_696972 [Camillea tinctor]|nr:hypothetical protein F4810DRAFT_696972 [Camillea tinctor]
MIQEADTVTSYINTLLDLRQAEYSRTQANDSAKQANIIFVFTVVTIVFLPLSFLSSLFVLDITSFPHEGGDLKYEGRWIFPILFGVTAIVSIPTIVIAWKVNSISGWVDTHIKEDPAEKPKLADAMNDDLARRSPSGSCGKNLRYRWRKSDKNVLPQHEEA